VKKDTLLKRLLFASLFGIALILILTLCKITVTGYMAAAVLYAAVFVFAESYSRKKYLRKKRELLETDEFLSAVRHEFHTHGMVDEAVTDAALASKSEYIKREAAKILEVLNAEDMRARADLYRMSGNRYLSVFLTLCITVVEYGDKRDNGGSLFLNNLMDLKEELRLEAEADELLNSKMAGVCMVSAAPAFCLKLIEGWSVGNLPEMEEFYNASTGLTMLAALFTLSVTVYAVNYLLRSTNDNLTLKKSIFEKIHIPKRTERFLFKTERAFRRYSLRQARLIARAGVNLTVPKLYYFKIVPSLAVVLVFSIALISAKITGEASVSIGFILVLVALCFIVPDVLLMLKGLLNRMKMDEEVMQYQTIIGMLAAIEFVSVYEILEELEHFAIIFKHNISDCLNDYNSGEESALEKLGDSGNAYLKRLSDRLVMCDRIGVKKAMDELKADRSYYIKTRERKQRENAEKRAVLGRFLAFVPLVASVALYLIIPFAMESMRLLTEISAELNF